MNLCSRPFASEDDLEAMRRLVITGRQAANGTYYIHAGDLLWWYSYFTPGLNPRRFTTLWWGGLDVPGGLAGWSLFSPGYRALDVFLHPSLRGTPEAEALWIEAEKLAVFHCGQAGCLKLSTLWISEKDDWTTTHLLSRGFLPTEEYMDVMVRPLDEPVPEPHLPERYTLRSPQGESEAALRAMPQYAAFESEMPQDVYIGRYAQFMRSPGYPAGLDLMVVTGDERGVAFCIVWPDEVNRVGLFEPVGVHPGFHRQGLGRAVVNEGLRRLQTRGMEHALVCGLSGSPDARAFYASLGFQPVARLITYEKIYGV